MKCAIAREGKPHAASSMRPAWLGLNADGLEQSSQFLPCELRTLACIRCCECLNAWFRNSRGRFKVERSSLGPEGTLLSLAKRVQVM
jgi:hypothetical protein